VAGQAPRRDLTRGGRFDFPPKRVQRGPPRTCATPAAESDSASVVGNDSCSNSASPAIAGDVRPLDPFAPFVGQSYAGTWRITARDVFPAADAGEVTSWCLRGPPGLPPGTIFLNGFEN
jgi:hypothetical protein